MSLGYIPFVHQCRTEFARNAVSLGASKEASVGYYRCDNCGHVWTHEKDNPDAPPEDVTIRDKKVLS